MFHATNHSQVVVILEPLSTIVACRMFTVSMASHNNVVPEIQTTNITDIVLRRVVDVLLLCGLAAKNARMSIAPWVIVLTMIFQVIEVIASVVTIGAFIFEVAVVVPTFDERAQVDHFQRGGFAEGLGVIEKAFSVDFAPATRFRRICKVGRGTVHERIKVAQVPNSFRSWTGRAVRGWNFGTAQFAQWKPRQIGAARFTVLQDCNC